MFGSFEIRCWSGERVRSDRGATPQLRGAATRSSYAVQLRKGNRGLALVLPTRNGSATAHERGWHLGNSAAETIARETSTGHAAHATAARALEFRNGSSRPQRSARWAR